MRPLLALALLLVLVPAVLHADPVMAPEPWSYTQLPDPAAEVRAQALMQTIRCVVCQGQSIADSDADLAGDMRAIIRQRIAAGESPQAIRGWMIARYGRWISYQPPLDPLTAPLWAAPIVLLAIGLLVARGTLRRRRAA